MAKIRSLYGSVMLERQVCPQCGEWSIIKDGKTACCDEPAEAKARRTAQRMSGGTGIRCKPTKGEQNIILWKQKQSCFYCGRSFGSAVFRNGNIILLRLEWDHFVPFSYTLARQNFVAACHICNQIKASMVFETPEEAREYVAKAREKKGYGEVPTVWPGISEDEA